MAKMLFFSGAGLSADSGLGVFRGGNGLWDKYDINKVKDRKRNKEKDIWIYRSVDLSIRRRTLCENSKE